MSDIGFSSQSPFTTFSFGMSGVTRKFSRREVVKIRSSRNYLANFFFLFIRSNFKKFEGGSRPLKPLPTLTCRKKVHVKGLRFLFFLLLQVLFRLTFLLRSIFKSLQCWACSAYRRWSLDYHSQQSRQKFDRLKNNYEEIQQRMITAFSYVHKHLYKGEETSVGRNRRAILTSRKGAHTSKFFLQILFLQDSRPKPPEIFSILKGR